MNFKASTKVAITRANIPSIKANFRPYVIQELLNTNGNTT